MCATTDQFPANITIPVAISPLWSILNTMKAQRTSGNFTLKTFIPRRLSGVRGMIGLVCGVAAFAANPTSAQTITVVPAFPGGSSSVVYAVNSTGTAAAGYSNNAGGTDTGLRWFTPGGGSGNMGFLPGGGLNSYAQAMDASGTALAGYGDSFGNTRAFRATTSFGFEVLPLVPGTGNFATASGISAAGTRVVGTGGVGSLARAFLWDLSNPTVSLNLGVISGQTTSGARAISGDGTVVVGSSGPLAFRWTSAGGMQSLGTPLPGQVWALGEAANTNGSVITGRYSNGNELGYRWTAATGMVALPQSPGGSAALRPRAVNGDGTVIIGQVVDNVAGFTAFVWTPSLGTQLLPAHLSARGVNMTGWQITDATGISADGTAMCGNGFFNGLPRGWVVRGLPCAAVAGIGWGNPTGCLGSGASFGSNTSFVVGAVYRWARNGVILNDGVQPSGSVLSGATTTQMTMTNMQPGDAGNYTFSMSSQGACESTISTFFPGPTNAANIVVQPTPNTACQGQNPALFCAANTPNGSVTYRWQKFVGPGLGTYANIVDGPSGNGSSYVGTGTSTFSILNAQTADSTLYRCAVGHAFCGPTPQVYSVAVQFTITPAAPTVTGPGNSYQCGGDNDAFMGVTTVPAAGCTYRWQKYIGPGINSYADIFDGPTGNGGFFGQTNSAVLGVYSFSAAEANNYRCRVTGPCGGVTISSSGYLGVIPPAAIITNPSNAAICPGDNDINFSVTATPGVSYRWQKYVGRPVFNFVNIFDGPTGNGGNYGQTGTAVMGIYGVYAGDYTQYRCVVTDPCYLAVATSAPATLVTLNAPVVATQPVGGAVGIGGTKVLTFTLVPSGNGNITYQWWRYVAAFPIYVPLGNGVLPSGAVINGAQSPTLTISNFQSQDAGQYYCMIIGDCNSGPTAVATLTAGVACSIADISGGGPNGDQPDGILDGSDFIAFINSFSTGDVNVDPRADIVGGGPNGLDPDGIIDGSDFIAFINAFSAGC